MKAPLIFSLFNQHPFINKLQQHYNAELGKVTLRNFPDGESYFRIESDVRNRDIIIVESLAHPSEKVLPLLFSCETLHELGAKRVGLIAPYLAYMRQDKRFHAGEGVTSNYFAKLLSHYVDWLVTVDPHLHRHHSLDEIYSIPSSVVHAAAPIAKWIKSNIAKPVLIGPDSESEQWVSDIAKRADVPFMILQKTRYGDREVEISAPEIENYHEHTPVLIDDIISTAQTMLETLIHLLRLQLKPTICIGVHAIFAGDAYEKLQQAHVDKIVTCNTILHESNGIELDQEVLVGVEHLVFGS